MFNKILSLYQNLIVYPVEKYDLDHYYFYKSNKKEDIFGISKKISLNEIKSNDYVLTPGRYVGTDDVEDEVISFEERMKIRLERNKERMLKIEKQNIQKKAIISTKVKHQDIGGKEIILEKELLVKDFLDTKFNEMPIAMTNFIIRRLDFVDEKNENKKVYYGHVGDFGYFVAEDEIEMIEDERENDIRKSY